VDITCAIPALALYCTLMMSYYYLPRFPHSVSSLSVCEIELHRLDMMINVKKSLCLRIGPRHNAKCSNLIASDSTRYLGVNIVAGHKFACSLDTARGLSIAHLMPFLARWVGSSQKTS